ncbi:unnamed protein product [Euphydryas editha]|uniref:Uncharacterized protein n=1 Tax=Euphydryas editha TaxID=104508 RepID=A0AAU9UFA6_EUPED|nr:unnamed protein product [Euphydryas editha]
MNSLQYLVNFIHEQSTGQLRFWSHTPCGTISDEGEEDIGDLYQDDENGAALLIRRHPKHGKIVVEGSIGHNLVIRPIPDSMTAPDDEMFMDPTSMKDMVSIDTGMPIVKRKKVEQEEIQRALQGAGHVIIKRDPAQGDHLSDYGKPI